MIVSKATSRPVKFGNRGAWQAEADHMRAHPGETFIIERRAYPNKAAYALAAHVRSGGYVAFRPAKSFDAWVEREGDQLEVIAVYQGSDYDDSWVQSYVEINRPENEVEPDSMIRTNIARQAAATVAPAPEPETGQDSGTKQPAEQVRWKNGEFGWRATILGVEVLAVKSNGQYWRLDVSDGTTLTHSGWSFADIKQDAEGLVQRYLERRAQETGQDTAAVDPTPEKPRRTVAVTGADTPPAAGPETVAAPTRLPVEDTLSAIKAAAEECSKEKMSADELAKATGLSAEDIHAALAAADISATRAGSRRYYTSHLARPVTFMNFRVLEIAGDYRHEYAARLRENYRPDEDEYCAAWKRMACSHLIPDADEHNDGFESCDCWLTLFYLRDGGTHVDVYAEFGRNPIEMPVALTPFATY